MWGYSPFHNYVNLGVSLLFWKLVKLLANRFGTVSWVSYRRYILYLAQAPCHSVVNTISLFMHIFQYDPDGWLLFTFVINLLEEEHFTCFPLFVIEQWDPLSNSTILRPTLDEGPGSNLDWFEANWILELECTLVPSLILGSSNQELSF